MRTPGLPTRMAPVAKAARNGHTATVVALVQECGADAGAVDKYGTTPVAIAASNGHTVTVVALGRNIREWRRQQQRR